MGKDNKINGKAKMRDFHFIFRHQNSAIEAFILEAGSHARTYTAHFQRILEERYNQPKPERNDQNA